MQCRKTEHLQCQFFEHWMRIYGKNLLLSKCMIRWLFLVAFKKINSCLLMGPRLGLSRWDCYKKNVEVTQITGFRTKINWRPTALSKTPKNIVKRSSCMGLEC